MPATKLCLVFINAETHTLNLLNNDTNIHIETLRHIQLNQLCLPDMQIYNVVM